jgi:hypothetical protein
VVETVDVIKLDCLIPIADRVLIRERLQLQGPGTRGRKRPLRQSVELQRPLLRRQHNPLIEVAVAVVGDHRCAFRHEGANATQMIEVIMGVDEVTDRLIGEGPLGFGDHGERALLIERPLDDRDEVLELDGDAVVRAAVLAVRGDIRRLRYGLALREL